MKLNKLIDFLFELGMLRRIKHEGWRLAGVDNPESVAEHSLRAAQIAYVLAYMEGCKNPEKVACMLIFHDIAECRIGDLHKLANRYVEVNEEKVVNDQVKSLGKLGEDISKLWLACENRKGAEGQIAKDADYLEQALIAQEYVEQGYKSANDWINNVSKALKTKSAKALLKQLKKSNSSDWWQGLKKL